MPCESWPVSVQEEEALAPVRLSTCNRDHQLAIFDEYVSALHPRARPNFKLRHPPEQEIHQEPDLREDTRWSHKPTHGGGVEHLEAKCPKASQSQNHCVFKSISANRMLHPRDSIVSKLQPLLGCGKLPHFRRVRIVLLMLGQVGPSDTAFGQDNPANAFKQVSFSCLSMRQEGHHPYVWPPSEIGA